MADFHVRVRKITQPVIDHPNADRLTIVKIDGYQCIANKHEDGSWRYQEGDYVVYIPEGAALPEWLLRHLGMWDEDAGKGMLAGAHGNRVKAIKLRDVVSQGILVAVYPAMAQGCYDLPLEDGSKVAVEEGDDVAELLGITKYEPPIPTYLAGEVLNLHGHTIHYDIESLQSYPDMFEDGEHVVVTEKLHGTCCDIGFLNTEHPELFGERHNIYVASKGLGGKGLVFKNSAANARNLYVRTLRGLLEDGLEDKVRGLFCDTGETHILGEIFGPGVQDLHYDLKAPEFRVFDIVNEAFVYAYCIPSMCEQLGLKSVPVLCTGAYSLETVTRWRDGQETINGAHMREGIVIKSANESRHPVYGRKIAKFVSPAYLLRKNKNATEFQ